MCLLNTLTRLLIACVMCVVSSIGSAATPMIQGSSGGALIMKSDASLWVVGRACNDTGTCVFTSPVRATTLSGTKSIAIAGQTNFVVKEDGTVWTWGTDDILGIGLVPSNGLAPSSSNQFPLQQVTALSQIQSLHCQWRNCLALGRDGRVWSWGQNDLGQVGDGTTIDRWTPILINGLPTIIQIWSIPFRSLALAADGSIWGWGSGLGQVPALYGGAPNLISNVTAVAGSIHGDVFLKSDGSVWTYGGNEYGQRGNGSVSVLDNTFTRVNNLSDIIIVRANSNRFLALKRDGTVWAWGSNIGGAMGAGSFTQSVYDQPVMLALPTIVAIEVGAMSSYAIAPDGTIYGWGNNELGGLGDNGATNRASPVRMSGPGGSGLFNVNLDQVPTNRLPLARYSVTPTQGTVPLLVTVDGSASTDPDGTIVSYQWFSSDGQTRSGKQATFTFNSGGRYFIRPLVTDNAGATATTYPAQIVAASSLGPISTPPMLAAGGISAAALRNDGKAFSWGGRNVLGRQVSGGFQGAFPKLIDNLSGITQISMGIEHGLAVLADGTLAAWGVNSYGQLGDGTTQLGTEIPVTVAGLSNMIAVSAGGTHSLALKSDGTVYAWGANQYGQFGTGVLADSFVPIRTPGISDVVAIATPKHSSVALKRDGTVWAWGNNTRGELGIGTRAVTQSPTQIVGLSGIAKIWCGAQHCFARATNGSTWAWGAGDDGSLGTMLTSDALSPIRVTLLDDFSEFALMGTAALGLRPDGTVWALGSNRAGELGQGFSSTASQLTPIRVPNITNAIKVAFGGSGTGYALRADGTVRSWGDNRVGTIGDGTLARRLSAVSVTNSTLDGPLDLLPDVPNDTGTSLDPLFYVQTASTGDLSASTVVVDSTVRFRPTDVGTTASTYVFALAPATLVKGAQLKGGADINDPAYHINLKTTPSVDAKDGPLGCVLAQLNSAGQLTAVSASNLQAYVTGVLSAGGTAVNVLNNISAAAIQGSTFYVGYGATGTSMINNGVNRSVASIPGTQTCQPQAPQTGWWWDPVQRDRGYGIEVRGNKLYYVSFMNNPTGTPSWTVASGPTALDGSLFQASLYSYANGQTLTGPLKAPTGPATEGLITISTATATQSTLIAPAGTRSIARMEFIPTGLTTASQTTQPESGWWWNKDEPGRGYFIEWQNGYAKVTGYMYDDAGKPIWYQSMAPTADPRVLNGTWFIFGSGYPLTQMGSSVNRKMARLTDNFQPLSIRFSDASNGTLTLPGGRNIAITRLRF